LFGSLKQEIVKSVSTQLDFGAERKKVIIVGKKNATFFKQINKEYNFFKDIVVLDHPRYIMQYKRKQIDSYLKEYIDLIHK
jgi:F0F1-type ATP synthase gamma subunit